MKCNKCGCNNPANILQHAKGCIIGKDSSGRMVTGFECGDAHEGGYIIVEYAHYVSCEKARGKG